MYCPNCGAELSAGAKFCSKCGQGVSSTPKTNSFRDRFAKATGAFSDMAKSVGKAVNDATDGKAGNIFQSAQDKVKDIGDGIGFSTNDDVYEPFSSDDKSMNIRYSYNVSTWTGAGVLKICDDRIVFSNPKKGNQIFLLDDIEFTESLLPNEFSIIVTNSAKKHTFYTTENPSESVAYVNGLLDNHYSVNEDCMTFRGKIKKEFVNICAYDDRIEYQTETSGDMSIPYSTIIDFTFSNTVINIIRVRNPIITIEAHYEKETFSSIAEFLKSKLCQIGHEYIKGEEKYGFRIRQLLSMAYLSITDEGIYLATKDSVDKVAVYNNIEGVSLDNGNTITITLFDKKNGKSGNISYSSLGLANVQEAVEYIKKKQEEALADNRYAPISEKEFGLYDKLCVNESRGTFFIKYANAKRSKVFLFTDILSCDVDEVLAGNNAYSNATLGRFWAGRDGAALAATFSAKDGDVKAINLRIMVRTEREDVEIIQFDVAGVALFGASKTSKKYSDAKAEAMKIEQYLKPYTERKEQAQQQVQVVQTSDADELRKYKQLFDDGIITEEEFNAKKKQLLGL